MRLQHDGWMRIRRTEFLFTPQLRRTLFPARAGIALGCCCNQVHVVIALYFYAFWRFNEYKTSEQKTQRDDSYLFQTLPPARSFTLWGLGVFVKAITYKVRCVA